MDVKDALLKRRTALKFEPEILVLSREEIEDLILTATKAPSEWDLQPWRFIVVRDRGRKEALFNCTRNDRRVRDAAAVIIVLGDTRASEYAGPLFQAKVEAGLIGPEVAKQSLSELREYLERTRNSQLLMALRAPSFTIMNLLLLATERGIATAVLFDFDEPSLRNLFHIPERFVPVAIIVFGLASAQGAQTASSEILLSPQDIIFHEDMGRVMEF